jgi:hypothetical protein
MSCGSASLVRHSDGQGAQAPARGAHPRRISRLFAACDTLRTRTVLMTTYAAGLRLSEVCALQLATSSPRPDRMCLKVRQGKGGRIATRCSRHACWNLAPVLAHLPAPHLAVPQQAGTAP